MLKVVSIIQDHASCACEREEVFPSNAFHVG